MLEGRQYLIVREAAHIEPASGVFGERRKCITAQMALNGSRNDLDGADVLLWITPDLQEVMQSRPLDRSLGMELAPDCARVRIIDMTNPTADMYTPEECAKHGTTYESLTMWASQVGAIIKVPKPPEQTDVIESPNANTINEGSAESVSNPPSIPAAKEQSEDSVIPLSEPLEPSPLMPESLPDSFYDEEQTSVEIRIDYEEKPHFLGNSEWPDPIDLTKSLYKGTPMPLNLVPASLQPHVEDRRRRLGTPAGPVWFGLLGAIAGLAPDHVRLQPKQNDTDWTVHPCVWPLVIGGPSSGKSPAIEIGMNWVQKKDAEAVLQNMQKLKEHAHQMDIYADECAIARKNKSPLPPLRPEQEEPILREYWVSRGTTEGVTRLLQHSPKVVWYSQEFSSVLNGLDRYAAAGKGSGDREFVLQLYDAGPTKNTLAGKTVLIRNGSAVLCGGTTPTAMLSAAGGKLQRDGLLARMLFCMVPDQMQQGDDTEPDAEAAAVYSRVLDNLLDMTHPATIKLSPDAAAIYREFCDKLHGVIKSEDSEYLTGTLGKWTGAWGRLALIYWLIDCAANGQHPLDGDRISVAIAKQVSDFYWWQLGHQQQFWYEIMSDKAGRKFSQTIARYILANSHLTELKFRDHIAQPHHDALEKLKPWEIKDAINTLITAAWIAPQGPKTNSHGVATTYDINPKISDMFEDERADELVRRAAKREEWQRRRGLID